eukprot:TRINITY_DN4943_c0_g1_i1.p2 TRINITY_DN4943_c0_g1~~TRINITY_DN4943_c0_g1_i1.p2  ORF type:complete len:147 (-),score=1.95 TRINITY_DN4943_c0_g1_i1:190-630(-)
MGAAVDMRTRGRWAGAQSGERSSSMQSASLSRRPARGALSVQHRVSRRGQQQAHLGVRLEQVLPLSAGAIRRRCAQPQGPKMQPSSAAWARRTTAVVQHRTSEPHQVLVDGAEGGAAGLGVRHSYDDDGGKGAEPPRCRKGPGRRG